MDVVTPATARSGGIVPLTITIANTGSGHDFPTGLPEGRIAWLAVHAYDLATGRELSIDDSVWHRTSIGVGNLTAQTALDPQLPAVRLASAGRLRRSVCDPVQGRGLARRRVPHAGAALREPPQPREERRRVADRRGRPGDRSSQEPRRPPRLRGQERQRRSLRRLVPVGHAAQADAVARRSPARRPVRRGGAGRHRRADRGVGGRLLPVCRSGCRPRVSRQPDRHQRRPGAPALRPRGPVRWQEAVDGACRGRGRAAGADDRARRPHRGRRAVRRPRRTAALGVPARRSCTRLRRYGGEGVRVGARRGRRRRDVHVERRDGRACLGARRSDRERRVGPLPRPDHVDTRDDVHGARRPRRLRRRGALHAPRLPVADQDGDALFTAAFHTGVAF